MNALFLRMAKHVYNHTNTVLIDFSLPTKRVELIIQYIYFSGCGAKCLAVGFPGVPLSVDKLLPFWPCNPAACDTARCASLRNVSYDRNPSNHQCAAHNDQQTQGQPDTDAHAKTCISTDSCCQECIRTHKTNVQTQTHTSPSHTELQLKSLVW